MSNGKTSRYRIWNDENGATIVEFAIIAPCLMMVMLGLLDLGMRAYIGVQLQGALEQAARQVTVVSKMDKASIDAIATTQVRRIIPSANVELTPSSYYDFGNVRKPEPITTDVAPIGRYNKGDCFQDLNANGSWDADAGARGTGGSDDIVYYDAKVTYANILPVAQLLGFPSVTTVNGTTMMRNQPYASQPDPPIICT